MDAQELQRLKELAQVAMGESDDDWYGPEFLRMQLNFSEDESKFVTAATPAAVLELIEIAERAVSPAESVQSIDTPEFREKLNYAIFCHGSEAFVAIQRLIAHIDAQMVKDHNRGYKAGHRDTWKDYEAALEKEKERADRAETVRQVPDLGHLPCYKLIDGRLIPAGIVKTIIDRGDMMLSLLDVRTTLSSTAQPLQQEGGKAAPIGEIVCDPFGGSRFSPLIPWTEIEPGPVYSASQPLQQKGEKEVPEGWALVPVEATYEMKSAGVRHSPLEYLNHAADVWTEMLAHAPAAPHPSDNLQQTSTAQAEPVIVHLRDFMTAEQIADSLSPNPVMNCTEALQAAVNSFSEQALTTANPAEAKKAWLDALTSGTGVLVGGKHVTYHDMLKPATPEGAAHKKEYKSESSQFANSENSTPEGADLPPLPRAYGYLTGCNLDMESSLEAAQAVCDHDNAAEMAIREHDPSYADPDWQPAKPEPLFDADQMRKYARAALVAQQNSASNSSNNSATTAAEPVYQMRHRIEPVWTDCSDFVVESWLENGGDPTRVRTLYRAAPPQQVDTSGLPG